MIRILTRQFFIVLGTLMGVSLLAYLPQAWRARAGVSAGEWLQNYSQFLNALLRGDWGSNPDTGVALTQELARALPASFELAFIAMLLATSVGLLLGVAAARHQDRWPDRLIGGITLLGYSIPTFWWAFLLVLLFSFTLQWTPVSGRLSFLFDIENRSGFVLIDTLRSSEPYALEAFADALKHLLLPAVVCALLPIAVIARVTRSALVDVLNSDFIRMARGQGVPEWRLLWIHGLRNAAVPLLNVLALQLSVFVTCQMLTERIFSWPGIGTWLLDAIARRHYHSVAIGVFVLASFIVLVNAFMDVLQSRLNPLRWRKTL